VESRYLEAKLLDFSNIIRPEETSGDLEEETNTVFQAGPPKPPTISTKQVISPHHSSDTTSQHNLGMDEDSREFTV